MALLSPDAQTFAQALSVQSGLALTVCEAWVLAESGGADKADHNYLNMTNPHGGWASYSSAQAAATDAAQNLATPLYANVRAAIPGGPAAQVAAIKASPWDAGHYQNGVLDRTFAEISGAGAVLTSTITQVGGGIIDAGGTLSGIPGAGALGQVLQGGSGASPATIVNDAFAFALGGHSPAELAVRALEVIAGGIILAGGLILLAIIVARKPAQQAAGSPLGKAAKRASELALAAVMA